eukprot:COSAG02_NODE_64691_length_260_cov_0.490683_1_plen_51_part_10
MSGEGGEEEDGPGSTSGEAVSSEQTVPARGRPTLPSRYAIRGLQCWPAKSV